MSPTSITTALLGSAGLILLALYMLGVPGWWIIIAIAVMAFVPTALTAMLLLGWLCHQWLKSGKK